MVSNSAASGSTPLVWQRGKQRHMQTLPDSWGQGWGRGKDQVLGEPRAENNEEPKAIILGVH